MEDHYQILGVPASASEKQIKERYRFLAHAYHPDKFASSEHKSTAKEQFQRINEAFQVLSSPSARAAYDRKRKASQGGRFKSAFDSGNPEPSRQAAADRKPEPSRETASKKSGSPGRSRSKSAVSRNPAPPHVTRQRIRKVKHLLIGVSALALVYPVIFISKLTGITRSPQAPDAVETQLLASPGEASPPLGSESNEMDAVTHRLMASSGRIETLEVESLVSRDADYMAGVQAMAAENHAKAYESFHRVLNRYPTSRSALTKLLASLAEKFPNSMEIREQSMNVVHNPASVDAWMCLGQALQESHLPQEASFAYKQALLVDDQYAIAWHALGLALKEQGNSGEAVAAFRRAAEENPHYLASWNSLISTLSELGRNEDAITLCSMAVEKNPQDPSIWSRYGITLLASGLKEDALGALKKAVDLDPLHREAWTNLAKVYEMLGQNEAARNAAEQVSLLKRDS